MVTSRTAIGRSGKRFDRLDALSTQNNLWALRQLGLELAAERTLEIGLAFGGSGLVFTANHRDLGHAPARQHVALDPFQMTVWDACGVRIIEQAGLTGYLDFRPARSCLELPKLVAEGARFGLVYVDGSHLVEDVFVDAYFATRLLEEGGVVAFDDSTHPHVRKVLSFLRTNCRAALAELDLRPYRVDGGATATYRVARWLKKTQMTAFRRIGGIDRAWDSPFRSF